LVPSSKAKCGWNLTISPHEFILEVIPVKHMVMSRLKAGEAVVEIDPTYAETVNTEVDYHVFLTPRGECKGLYVASQKEGFFEVRELNGGKSDIPFSYRIVAKRKGYEGLRLVKVEEEMTTAMAAVEDDIQGVAAMDVASNAK
jgi:hypothetical protein